MGAALITIFEGAELPSYVFRGRPCWIAAEAGVVAGYAEGRNFVDQIRGDWREDFRAGRDFELLRGRDLREFRGAANDSGESPESFGRGGARSLLVLYESGLLMGLLLAKTDRGRRLRRFIVDEVLPQLLRTGRVVLPCAPDDAEQVRAENARLRAEVAEAWSSSLAGVIGPSLADVTIRGPLDELALFHPKGRRAGLRHYANRLRNAVGFNGAGTAWEMLPRTKLADAQLELRALRVEAEKAAAQARRNACGTASASAATVQLAFSFALEITLRRGN